VSAELVGRATPPVATRPAPIRAVVQMPRRRHLAPAQTGATAPARPVDHDAPLRALAAQLADVCADAIDAFEVAATLEAEGINDSIATSRYGHRDVFALAETLYRRTRRRPRRAPRAENPWVVDAPRHVLRGVLFGLPGLCFVATSSLLNRPGAVTLIAVSLLVAWAASEALSYLGYVRIGMMQRSSAARILLLGGPLAALAVGAVDVLAGALLHTGWPVVAVAAGQAGYLLMATVALVLGAEQWLLLVLVPGAAISATGLIARLPTASWSGVALTLAGTAVVAVLAGLRARPGDGRGAGPGDLVRAFPQGLFGLFVGGLLIFPTLGLSMASMAGPAAGAPAGRVQSVALVALPLSLSMGAAEWILFRFRRRTFVLQRSTRSLPAFGSTARRAVYGAIGGYLAVLAVLVVLTASIATVVMPAGGGSGAPVPGVLSVVTALALGGALFAALALRSCGATWAVLAICGAGFGVDIAIAVAAPVLHRSIDLAIVHLLVCAALFAALVLRARTALGRVTAHR
jgi:hypothetical protein